MIQQRKRAVWLDKKMVYHMASVFQIDQRK